MMLKLNDVVVLCGLAASLWYAWRGMHANAIDPSVDRLSRAANARDRGTTGFPDYAVAGVAFATAVASAAHIFSPAVAYAVLCLAIASSLVADQLGEERVRARGRRAAVLQPTPRVDPVLLTWIALAAASTLLLAPSMFVANQRAVAGTVAISCVAMVILAWRIASAPRLLSGDDVEAEVLLDRTRRIRRTGLVCITAVGCASFYASIAEGSMNFSAIGLAVWFALIVWLIVYLRIASRTLVLS
ncbi:MAG: hypothetical protein WBD74_03095 [Candidatus Aquilonibacter sp.]